MFKRILLRGAGVVGLFVVGVFLYNSSWFETPQGDGRPRLLSHRGVHQTFPKDGVGNDTCTAARINPPSHNLIENTLPSMAAAFEAGAEVVELDVHLTTDEQFAVFHDWTLECRTDGKGVTEQFDMAHLKTLDLGYGYTADGGKTFPLRGQGVGLMPTLTEVLEHFPGKRFLINFKSGRTEEGEALARLVRAHPEWRNAIWGTYGGAEPTEKSLELIDGLQGYTSRSIKACAVRYFLVGWTGVVPDVCRNTMIIVPANFSWAVWGWPHKFMRRMADAGTTVILTSSFERGNGGTSGVDAVEELAIVPEKFGGYVWTNRIELIGPKLTTSR